MKVWMNVVIQLLGILVSSSTVITNVVPDKYKPLVVLVMSLLQAFTAWYAHQFNPDGTPATIAYVQKP